MKAAKFLVLIAGGLAVAAWFVPMLTWHGGSTSVLEAILGAESIKRGGLPLDASQRHVLWVVQGYLLLGFGPTTLLLAIGGVAAGRGAMGRLSGLLAFVVGAWGTLVGGLVFYAFFQERPSNGAPGLAMYFLLGAGLIGVVCGLAILILPDRGPAPPPRMSTRVARPIQARSARNRSASYAQ